MSEAKQMHRDLMNMLLPILPRSVFGDIRRVANLVWAIVGLSLTQMVNDPKCGSSHGMRNELSFSSEVAPSRLSLLVWVLRRRRPINSVASKQAIESGLLVK